MSNSGSRHLLFLVHCYLVELIPLFRSAIIDDIEINESTSMAYFAFDFKDSHKQTRLDMIPSLLTQLATWSERCCDIVSRLYSTHYRGARMATGAVLAECLKDMISLPGQGNVSTSAPMTLGYRRHVKRFWNYWGNSLSYPFRICGCASPAAMN